MGSQSILGRLARRAIDWENGFERRLKEHFTVLVAREGAEPVAIAAPRGSYYADPFLIAQDGKTFLLVEQFHYGACIGRIAAVALDEMLRPGAPQTSFAPGSHTSFPFILAHEGKTYLLPETSNAGTLDLYVCEDFPGRWRPVRRLLDNIDAADSILFPRDGRWWLITSLREGAGRALAIYSSDDLLTGTWQAHPVNAEKRYAALPNSSGRNAGGAFLRDGTLYRVAQDNPHYYGENIRFLRIDALTVSDFSETEVPPPSGLPALAASFSPHHLSLCGGLAAWDVRDRTGWFTQRRIGNPKPAQ